MSGFRKLRSTLHRRRRAIEAAELGHILTGQAPDKPRTARDIAPDAPRGLEGGEREDPALDISPGAEAIEIGPQPISWVRPRRSETEN